MPKANKAKGQTRQEWIWQALDNADNTLHELLTTHSFAQQNEADYLKMKWTLTDPDYLLLNLQDGQSACYAKPGNYPCCGSRDEGGVSLKSQSLYGANRPVIMQP